MFAKLTSELGFQRQNTILLLNASKFDILQEVEHMLDRMSCSDVVVFYFAGHVSGLKRKRQWY